MNDLLAGIRVVEMGIWVAGPAASGVMSDWGADVIKIEPPSGDPMRAMSGWPGYTEDKPHALFAINNRGKKSVVLDLHKPAAREAMDRLLSVADVFVTNMRPGAVERLGLTPSKVMERHPHLVYASVTGYGLQGPDTAKPGYDVGAFWARTGIAHQLTPAEQYPLTIRPGLGDHTTGLAALSGILAALLNAKSTGKGRLVDASLLRTGTYCLGWDFGLLLATGEVRRASPRHDSYAPLVNSYQTSDERWFFLMGVEGDRHFPSVLRALGREDLLQDARFSTIIDRYTNRAALIEIFDGLFVERTLDEWAARFDADGVWWSPVLSPAEVVDDPQAQAAGSFIQVSRGSRPQGLTSVNSPVRFDGDDDVSELRAVPELGEHTDDVLREAGFSEDERRKIAEDQGGNVDP